MSRQSAAPTKSSMNSSMKKKTVMPACKHCENLKLPSSHWLRSLVGTIVCPILLATECRYCHLAGHTVKACPELALKNKNGQPPLKMSGVEPNKAFLPVEKRGFSVLEEYTDSEEEEGSARIYPEIESSWNGKLSFAKVVSKPPVENLSLIHPDKLTSFEFKPFPKSPENSPPIVPFSSIVEKYKGMSWAEMCDSDDEEFLIN
jgi:hypothetical protein